MHSTFRKELCGTTKFLQSVRTRPRSRCPTQNRKFSNRTYLSDQASSKDSTTSSSGTSSHSSKSSTDSSTDHDASAQGISADLEKWMQILSDRGQALHVWDTISEKDENGKRRLLPHIKNDLEKLGSRTSQDGAAPKTLGLEIQDGRIRALTAQELSQEQSDDKGSDNTTENFILHSNEKCTSVTTPKVERPIPVSATLEVQHKPQGNEFASGGDVPPQSPDTSSGSKFHGSSAARRQRERHSRTRDRAQIILLPDWFYEQNVLVWEEKANRAPQSTLTTPRSEGVGKRKREEPAVASSDATEPGPSQVMKDAETHSEEVNGVVEKEQTHTSLPPGGGSSDNGSIPVSKDSLDDSTSDLIALPNANKRYYIQRAQRQELALTARGRLRLPANGSLSSKPGGIRSHILVHYTTSDGDIFLDRLIEDVADQLQCDLVTLDAQDISALISKAEIDPMMTDEAETLSYEIYSEIYRDDIDEEEDAISPLEGLDDIDEEGPSGPHGTPFMVGKPITIDLQALFGPRNRRGKTPFSKNIMPDMLGRGPVSKPVPHVFQALVDSILSSPNNRRKVMDERSSQQTEQSSNDSLPLQNIPQGATIVHVKDLKAIQETRIGKHFLTQLYDQVERRRSNGEAIMLVGTSCDRDVLAIYNEQRINKLQVSEPDEISSTIAITPAYPDTIEETESESSLRHELQRDVIPKQDRAKRVQIINARHLYEMLRSKDVFLDSLKEGFWARDVARELDKADQRCLSALFWPFSYVQRLAAILASSDIFSPHPIADAVEIIERSDDLKYKWAIQTQPKKPKIRKKEKDAGEHDDDKLAGIRAKATKHEKRLLSGVVEPTKIGTTFKDIHIPPETVDALQTLTTLSLVRPDAFKYGVLASDRIPGLLLYGPPGTGKTLAAKAVARESGATMLEVSAADINDMYVGEGEKNVKALFSLARKLSPCVVFLDEADAMFSARSNAGRRVSHRELLNQFLKEWDGMSNDSGSAFIMVATNRPMDLDDAVLRRLPRRLLVDLPTEKDRLEILKIHLRHEHLSEDVNLSKIAAHTQFYSGSDLKNVAVAAALNCVREENELAKQHSGSAQYKYADKRTLTSKHFDRALEEISASISEDMASLRDIKKFDEQYGDRKGRKRRSPRWGFKTAAEADTVLDTVKVRP